MIRRLYVQLAAAIVMIWCPMVQAGELLPLSEIVLYALALAFIGNAGYAPILIFLNERFPTAERASGN